MSILTFTSNSPEKSTISIVNGATSTGYALNDDGPDFGAVTWNSTYAGQRGTQGARPGYGTPDNRTVSIPIRVYGSTKDNMATRITALTKVVEDMRRYGGTILWKSSNATYRVYFTVLTAGASLKQWTNRVESNNIADLVATFSCAPYALGDPMDTVDGFDSNTLATDWTSDINTAGATIATGSGLVTHTITTALIWRARHTLKGYHPRDVQVTLKVNTGTSITSAIWGVAARMDTAGADTMLVAELVAGTNVIRVGKYVAGAFTSLATAAITPAVSSTYWVRLRLEGNVAFAEAFTTAPTPTSTPAQSVSYALTTAEAARFFSGDCGVRITTASTVTTESYDDFTVEPFTYRLTQTPEELILGDFIPGDVPALADVVVSPLGGPASALAQTTPIWGSAAWHERTDPYNLCYNGDFDDAINLVTGWSKTLVANVQAASATTIAQDTTAANIKYGTSTMKVTCPATANTGANFPVFHRAKKGRMYVLLMWVSGNLTTNTSLFLGFNDGVDIAVGGATALSTAAPKLRVITWTPTADRDRFWAGIKITAATATNMFVDGVNIIEVTSPIALSATIASTSATTMTVYANPSDLPAVPFNVLNSNTNEIYRVSDTTTTTWTIARGQESSTAATAAIDDPIIVLPTSVRQYQGKGALPATGIIEAESYVPAISPTSIGTYAATAATDARGGFKFAWTVAADDTANIAWYVDPSLLVPDDYTSSAAGGEVDVEVWARIELNSAQTITTLTLSAQPEGGTVAGAKRYTREYGSSAKAAAHTSVTEYRFVHLGTVPMYVDRTNPLRWILNLNIIMQGTAGVNVDYLMLNVTRFRVCSITAKVNDANFPDFIPDQGAAWSNTSTMTKTLKADGTAFINEAGKPTYPDSGLGRTIEVPINACNAQLRLSNRIPDDLTTNLAAGDMKDGTGTALGTTSCYTVTTHFAVTPRFAVVRGS